MIETIAIVILCALCVYGSIGIICFAIGRQAFKSLNRRFGIPPLKTPKEFYWLFFGNGFVLTLKYLSVTGVL